ncbi:cytochrome d ubiquinol oxidase subunit II [Edaphobacter modestus]|uniref:cytochrome d ubiquinol oxidase subunit II n=1 Tax=Edaphobacter modestus TaxID=388466 RepID=UPI00102B3009
MVAVRAQHVGGVRSCTRSDRCGTVTRWLIAGGGTLFFAFPLLYASSFSGFYLPLTIVLWLLMVRGLSIELRAHTHDKVFQSFLMRHSFYRAPCSRCSLERRWRMWSAEFLWARMLFLPAALDELATWP